ncbi:MAG: hypothetical protein MI724_12410 [Spirochaetales bacterium]|nr:hypothetical protein [Spirochaetales bacterium]
MKARHRSILQQLAGREGYSTVEEIANACGAGVRTIHRDLEHIERLLALRGVRFERRRGYGVRLLDPLPEGFLDSHAAVGPMDVHDAADRPFLLLLYLTANPGWCKLSELAHVFFLSDSSMSTALGHLGGCLPKGLELERQKGVGVRVLGDEHAERLAFMAVFARLFPRYLPNTPDSDGPRLFRSLRIGDAGHRILRGIAAAEETLGYRFAPGYSSMVYSYLFLVRRRLPEGRSLLHLPDFRTDLPDLFQRAVHALEREALGDGIVGVLPGPEKNFLARVLAACEPLDPPQIIPAGVIGALEVPVEHTIECSLTRVEEYEHVWLHDDPKLLNYLRLTLAATTRRLDLFHHWLGGWLPHAHGTVERSYGSHIDILVDEYLAAFSGVLIDRTKDGNGEKTDLYRELQEPYLAIDARLTQVRLRRGAGMAVKVLCYEGLGMSAWLGSIVEGVLPSGATIDTRWEPVDTREWDLIIATYPIAADDTPCVVIDSDSSPETIRQRIDEAVQSIVRSGPGEHPIAPTPAASSGLSLPVIMSVVKTFFIAPLENSADAITRAVAELDRGDCDARQLLADFRRRESYGSLVFEDVGVRLLHCRSNGIPEPRVGVLRPPDAPAILVLAAPRTAPPEHTGVLSEIVVAIHDEPGFSHLLAVGEPVRFQEALIELFNRRLA